MPRFFFDFHDGGSSPVDVVGLELEDDLAAKREALIALKQALFLSSDEDDQPIACHVRDEAGTVIYCAGVNLTGGWVSREARLVP